MREVAVISLGGTIACAPDTDGLGLVPCTDPTVGLTLSGGTRVRTVPWSLTDSTEITFDEIARLAERARQLEAEGVEGIVITQGTDTIDEVAWTLSLLRPTTQPVVVTGAMRAPTTPGSDAEANLLAAIATAVLPELSYATTGAVVVMNNQIHSALWVQKSHTQNTDAFASCDAGLLGVISEGQPILLRHDIRLNIPELGIDISNSRPRVALLAASLDQDTALVDSVVRLGYAGLVMEGVGGGHVNGQVAVAMGQAAEHIPVVFAARPRSGAVLSRTYSSAGAELDLQARGCLSAGLLTAAKARILLTLLLRSGRTRTDLEHIFRTLTMTENRVHV